MPTIKSLLGVWPIIITHFLASVKRYVQRLVVSFRAFIFRIVRCTKSIIIKSGMCIIIIRILLQEGTSEVCTKCLFTQEIHCMMRWHWFKGETEKCFPQQLVLLVACLEKITCVIHLERNYCSIVISGKFLVPIIQAQYPACLDLRI